MQRKNIMLCCLGLAAHAVFCVSVTGCGSRVQVSIYDAQTETKLLAKAGITVEQALKEAEILIEEDDVVSPSLDTVVSEGEEISIGRCTEVTVTDHERSLHVELTGAKVRDAVKKAKAEIGKYDRVSHDMDAYLTDGMDITIFHRYEVSVEADGELKKYITGAGSVRELLKEQGIELGKKDQVTPELSRKLTDGTQIVIQRVSMREITEYEPIPYDTKVEYSSGMYQGETAEKQQGQAGEKEIVYKVSYVDGEEEERILVRETVTKDPVSNIIVKGTAVRRETTPAAPTAPAASGRRIVSREPVYDCDGSGHGYYVITWSDGEVEYQDF